MERIYLWRDEAEMFLEFVEETILGSKSPSPNLLDLKDRLRDLIAEYDSPRDCR